MNEYEFILPQLTSGESQDKLRRVDSNRKSRGFSKQPSTGDYYKTLGQEVTEPRGSRGMAPNEEVSQMFVFCVRVIVVAANKRQEPQMGTALLKKLKQMYVDAFKEYKWN